MKVSDYIVSYLESLGITHVFVITGHVVHDLIDSIRNTRGMTYVCVQNEQAGAMAAECYSRVTGKIGCAMATSGPGGMNLLTGIGCAYYDSIPCLYITGQIDSRFQKGKSGVRAVGFQENDIVSMAKPITKLAEMVKRPEDIRYVLEKATYIAQSGRKGPVLIDIPVNVQRADVRPGSLRAYKPPARQLGTDLANVVRAKMQRSLAFLGAARRPVLLIGGGVRIAGAVEGARTLVEKLGIPVLTTWNAIDVIPQSHPLYRGCPGTYGDRGANFTIQNSDFVLSIGSRIPGRMTGALVKSFARAAKKVVVDIDREELDNLQVPSDIRICTDAGQFMESLSKQLPRGEEQKWKDWVGFTAEWRSKYSAIQPQGHELKDCVSGYGFIQALSNILREDDVVVADCGGNIILTCQAFKVKDRQRVISANGLSPMGYAFAASMGAALAPGRSGQVVCIIGDGGMQVNIQEMQTVANYKLPIKTFIINNHCYGISRQFAEIYFESRYDAVGFGKGYSCPDFVKVAAAYGLRTERISNTDEVEVKIKNVLAEDGPVICDVVVDPREDYIPRLGWKNPIEDQYPYLPRHEFRKNLLVEPWEGWENPELVR